MLLIALVRMPSASALTKIVRFRPKSAADAVQREAEAQLDRRELRRDQRSAARSPASRPASSC